MVDRKRHNKQYATLNLQFCFAPAHGLQANLNTVRYIFQYIAYCIHSKTFEKYAIYNVMKLNASSIRTG
jgi:hypothetical protein